jgi:hypothetical protein
MSATLLLNNVVAPLQLHTAFLAEGISSFFEKTPDALTPISKLLQDLVFIPNAPRYHLPLPEYTGDRAVDNIHPNTKVL